MGVATVLYCQSSELSLVKKNTNSLVICYASTKEPPPGSGVQNCGHYFPGWMARYVAMLHVMHGELMRRELGGETISYPVYCRPPCSGRRDRTALYGTAYPVAIFLFLLSLRADSGCCCGYGGAMASGNPPPICACQIGCFCAVLRCDALLLTGDAWLPKAAQRMWFRGNGKPGSRV